jgi:FixJ family two-component response regulator
MNGIVPAVFVVDKDASAQRATARVLRAAGFPVEAFESAEEFLTRLATDDPGCAVLEVDLPDLGGLDLQSELAGRPGEVPVVFVTGRGDIPTAVRAMKAGAVDFLVKPIDGGELVDAVRRAMDRSAAARRAGAEQSELRRRAALLTTREREVMDLVVAGKLNKEVAQDLDVSLVTVKLHRSRVMKKMGARTPADLVRMAGQLTDNSQLVGRL